MQSESVNTIIEPLIGRSGKLSKIPSIGTLYILYALSAVFGAVT